MKLRISLMYLLIFTLLSCVSVSYSTQEQVSVVITEYVNQTTRFNPLSTGGGLWTGPSETLVNISLEGFINISNSNPENMTISDIYVHLNNISRTSIPFLFGGRNGSIVQADNDTYIIHIFELESGENSVWNYYINETIAHSPLNISTNYSDFKILAGGNLTITDTITNIFDIPTHKNNNCVYNIVHNQTTTPVNFSGSFYDFTFNASTINATDNNSYSIFNSNNLSMYWTLRNGSCLNISESESISYSVKAPFNIPTSQDYDMIESTLAYTINNTISHLRVDYIKGIATRGVTLEEDKQIVAPSDPILYGSNVTWNATGNFRTNGTNLSYTLERFTMWVAQRSGGVMGNPNLIDNDTISNATLEVTYTPNATVNTSTPWVSPIWLFNYSDLPSPILYSKAEFTIADDGVQLINRTFTRNDNELYIKELYLILGYWLDIEKNVTSLGGDSYMIEINVHNRGNQVTPGDAIVSVFDFVPEEFNVTSAIIYSNSTWYTTSAANSTINGTYNGTLLQWGIVPTNSMNTSFAQGPVENENTTWSAVYNITGIGEYDLLDVFITGVDPQKVDGASATKKVFVSEFVEKFRSTEGIFAVIASVMLVAGLIV